MSGNGQRCPARVLKRHINIVSDSVNIEKRVSYERCRKKETAKSIVLVGACRVVEDALPGWFAELDLEIRGFWMEIRFPLYCPCRNFIYF